jgi:hypothetical protein
MVEQLKWMGTSMTNQSCIHEGMKCRLNSGNVCCHSVQNLPVLQSAVQNIKTKVYRAVILLVVLYGYVMFPYYALQPEAYCAIWVRRSNFRRASPRVSPRASPQRRKVELWARNVQEFCLNAEFHVTFRDLLHAVKLRHGTDGFTSPPKEGVLRIFFALKIWLFWPGVNPRTWVPKASTLPPDHRSRMYGYETWSVTLNIGWGCLRI